MFKDNANGEVEWEGTLDELREMICQGHSDDLTNQSFPIKIYLPKGIRVDGGDGTSLRFLPTESTELFPNIKTSKDSLIFHLQGLVRNYKERIRSLGRNHLDFVENLNKAYRERLGGRRSDKVKIILELVNNFNFITDVATEENFARFRFVVEILDDGDPSWDNIEEMLSDKFPILYRLYGLERRAY